MFLYRKYSVERKVEYACIYIINQDKHSNKKRKENKDKKKSTLCR